MNSQFKCKPQIGVLDADFAILGWAWRHERHKVDLADFPNVKAWYERCMARPATKKGFEVALS